MTCQHQNHSHYVLIWILSLCVFLLCCQMAIADEPGTLNKWQRHAIADLPDRAIFIQGADVDSDGHQDLIAGGW